MPRPPSFKLWIPPSELETVLSNMPALDGKEEILDGRMHIAYLSMFEAMYEHPRCLDDLAKKFVMAKIVVEGYITERMV